MPLKNTRSDYGLIAIVLHWISALLVIGLFALGLWMVELSYYDDHYKSAPMLHKGIGATLFLLLLLRLLWRGINAPPAPLPSSTRREQQIAYAMHGLLYGLLFTVMLTGYLISTADGRPLDIFGQFAIPALISDIPNLEDNAGKAHFILAVSLVALASGHALAALKHHFVDRDQTLRRMLSTTRGRSSFTTHNR
jgi:cytochrome b561